MITLRKAASTDAALLVAWRNADRDCFGDTSVITEMSHLRWWRETYQADPWDHLYVVSVSGTPAGTAGMKIHGPVPEVHRVLLGDKTRARTGVMTQALALLMGAYRYPAYQLQARSANTAAISFYTKNGFRPLSDDGQFLTMWWERRAGAGI